jgi:hypothetical protein
MLRMRQFRSIRIPPIFYIYLVAVLAMAAVALTRINHI